MEWERYDLVESSDGLGYAFYSEGPNGRFRKAIRFRRVPVLGRNVYNLAFGDYDPTTDRIDDKIVSNNGDREIVLHTVADAVVDFLKKRPLAIILIRGSSKSRIRLYQIGISFFWPAIKERYEVLGKCNEIWRPFEKGTNYEEFLVFKKIR
jgi:hypothetical protein